MAEKRLRTQAKTNLSRAANSLQETLDVDTSEVSLERLDYLVSDFELKLGKYDERQSAYELTFESEDEMNNEIEIESSYRSEKTDVLIRVKELISKRKTTGDEKASSNLIGKNNDLPARNVNLPRLQLPKFSGDILEFQEFWDKFTAIIDDRDDISAVNKFSYLQSVLIGSAKASLQGLALTAANYGTAKEMLVRRFGRTEKVIVAHIQKLLNISAKTSLWEIYDQVQVHVRSLANLNVSGKNYGLVLAPIILHQLPPSVRLEWARSGEGKEGDVEYLLNFLYEEIQRRERSTQLSPVCDRTSASGRSEVKRNSTRTTGSGLVASGSDNGRNNGKKCSFCSGLHYSDRCPTIKGLSVEQIKEKVKAMRLCFKCLSGKHIAKSCQKTCYFCRGAHHTVLHRSLGDQQPAGGLPEQQNSRGQRGSPSCPPFVPGSYVAAGNQAEVLPQNPTGGHAYYSQSSARGKSTLMQVIQTRVSGHQISVLFDSGSDFSYIREDTAKRLNLPKVGTESTAIAAFGGTVHKDRKHKVFGMNLGGIDVSLLCLKTISQPLYRPPVPADVIRAFKHLSVHDSLLREDEFCIDVLVGLDFYHDLMGQASVNAGNGLVAQETKLGWMVSGSYPCYRASAKNIKTVLFSRGQDLPEADIRKLWELDSIGIQNHEGDEATDAVIKSHLEGYKQDRTIKELLTNLYVDDWLSGSDREEELFTMMSRSEDVMQQGGFPLTKWTSNSQKVRDIVDKSFVKNEEENVQKILGLGWCTDEDCFKFETATKVGELYTKRSLLGLIARLFDPLGLLTPFTISLKILFQNVWRSGYEWDEVLPKQIQDEIEEWVTGLREVSKWKFPRRLPIGGWTDMKSSELYVFVDASEKAYGCCIYLKSTDDQGTSTRLVASKVRVAPLKKVTLPRLELLSALLGARLLKFVRDALELPLDIRYTCFTDSKIAQAWIRGDPYRWKQFVRNRVEEIQNLSNPACWHHCPGKDNPADLLTRGVKASFLTKSDLWLNGPSEILLDVPELTADREIKISKEEELSVEEETRKNAVCTVASSDNPLIQYERFSRFERLLRVTGLVLKFVGKVKSKRLNPETISNDEDNLREAHTLILKDLQSKSYSQELIDLKKDGMVSKQSSLFTLAPFLDEEGMIRVRGRLSEAPDLTYDEKHPVIIPKGHVSLLLVKSQHELLKHAGVGTLISSLRGRYWIISVRSLAKKVVKQCMTCRRYDARPLNQVTAPLPQDRVTQAPPFSVTGVDHAGPLYCSDTGDKKLYIVLFTCAITRALHLEIVDSLSVDDFVKAFRRFVARRALPSIIYSDNARTFKAANSLLQAHFGKEVVCWKNICPLSPNWGGWWERLVRSVKSSLKKSLGRRTVNRVELETILPEIEACVNSRPLMYIAEKGKILTPSHFLIGRATPLNSVELDNFEQVINLSARDEFEESLTEQFWQIWKTEYLRNLPPLTFQSKKASNSLALDSVVLIRDEKKPRMWWALGRVVKLYDGIDGKIRAVQLKTQKGLITRSINQICLLEDSSCEGLEVDTALQSPSDSQTSEDHTPLSSDQADNSPNGSRVDTVVTRVGRRVKPPRIVDV